MIIQSRYLVLPVLVLMLAALACQVGGAGMPSPDELATSVAATVAAFAEPTAAAPTGAVPPEPTAIPEPTTAPPAAARALGTDGGGNLWFWQEGASPRQLSFSGGVRDFLLSPDGATAVYQRSTDYANHSLWAVNTDGSGERQLLSEAELAALGAVDGSIGAGAVHLVWVPGSRSVAFATSPKFDGPGFMINDDLHLLDVDSLARTERLARGQGGRFAYSPDGSRIAIATATSVHMVDADGSNRRENLVSFPFINTASEYAYYPGFTWAADSSFVLTAIPPQDPWVAPPGNTTVWRVPADGSSAMAMSAFPKDFFSEVIFSPDASRMLYTTRNGDLLDLHMRNLDGSGDALLATGANLRIIGWNDAGSHFLFTTDGADAQVAQPGAAPLTLPGTAAAGMNIFWKDDGTLLYVLGSGPYEVRQRTLAGADSSLATGLAFSPVFK